MENIFPVAYFIHICFTFMEGLGIEEAKTGVGFDPCGTVCILVPVLERCCLVRRLGNKTTTSLACPLLISAVLVKAVL